MVGIDVEGRAPGERHGDERPLVGGDPEGGSGSVLIGAAGTRP